MKRGKLLIYSSFLLFSYFTYLKLKHTEVNTSPAQNQTEIKNTTKNSTNNRKNQTIIRPKKIANTEKPKDPTPSQPPSTNNPPESISIPETEISFPFFIENEKQQDIPTLVSNDKLFDVDTLKSQLQNWVFPVTISNLEKVIVKKNGKDWISLPALNNAGIVGTFNELTQELRLTIPANIKKDQTINLGGNSNIVIPDSALRPNKFSSYLNVNAKQPFGYSNSENTSSYTYNGRQNFYSEVQSVTNIDSLIFDLNGEYYEHRDFKRNDFRMIKDDPENMVRYTVGDVSPISGGFLNSRPIGGISASRDFSLQPNRTTTPISSYKVFIKRPSSVKIFVNEVFSQTIYLPSGTYDIRNLPVTVGVNNVELEVTDDLGQKEIITLPSFSFSQQNLKQGISQFNYSVGAPYTDSLTQRTYEKDHTTYSVSHRYGLTSQLTLGGYTQGDPFQNIVGLGATVSTLIGVFSLEEAYSKIYDSNSGLGSRLNYTVFGKRLQNNFSLNVEHKTFSFAQLGNTRPENTDILNLDSTYYQPIGRTGLTLANTYGINSAGMNPWSAAIGLSQNFNNDLSVGGSVSYGRDGNGIGSTGILFNLNWTINPNQNLSASYAPKTDEYSVQHRYSKEVNGTDKVETFLVDSNANSVNSINGDLKYYGRHGYLGLQEYEQTTSNFNGGSQKRIVSTTSIVGGFGLAYSGGAFALSQPINDSFVILKPDNRLKSQELIINPSNNKEHPYSAKSDWLSNAILPISGYQLASIQVGTPHLVEGLSLEKISFELYPGYRSGTALNINVVSFASIKGKITDINNKPIALYDGTIKNESEDVAIPIYTTEDGLFFVEGINPGKYTVKLTDPNESVFVFTIPKDSFGVVDLGTVQATSSK
jgi:outer membrane usher protein